MIETPHIHANKEDITSIVLMPGDPLRAKFIAETYLENYYLVNDIRGILGYTGTYKGKRITVFASGMGMPSMGIYCYELYKFFDVQNIIRIGSCGSNKENIKVLDVVLSSASYNEGKFAYTFNNQDVHEVEASASLNETIQNTAKIKNIDLKIGKTACSEVFDPYMPDVTQYLARVPKDIIASEMEAFALFYIAKQLKKQAACLLTVSDSKFEERVISSEERQTSLTNMIELALESAIRIGEQL